MGAYLINLHSKLEIHLSKSTVPYLLRLWFMEVTYNLQDFLAVQGRCLCQRMIRRPKLMWVPLHPIRTSSVLTRQAPQLEPE
jgi:hypothetical protein